MACTTCTTCGSSAPCACGSGSLSTCNQVGVTGCCGSSSAAISSCCSNIVQATPLPHYSCAPACPEDHTQKIVINKFAADIKITSSWNVPVCGESAIVTVPGLTAIAIGSYIWNAEFGYFEVTAFNAGTQQITIANRCTDGNAAAGTNVPACTEFIVTDPPVDISTQSGACVAVDFTAPPACPAVGCCINITLTTVTGIISGGIVQIGTGFYTVDAVLPNDIITICNNGDGILPGTSVIALDASGNYQYCLTILSSNPCDGEATESGTLVVCSEEAIHPMDESTVGYLPTVNESGTGNVAFRPPAFPDSCTTLAVDLPLINGTATYNITVGSTAPFFEGDTLAIGGRLSDVVTVTAVTDATHLAVSFSPTPSANATIGAGTSVCSSIAAVTPKFLVRDGSLLTIASTAVESDIGSFTVYANTLDANGYVRIYLMTTARTTAIATTVIYRVKINGVTVLSTSAITIDDDPANSCSVPIELKVMNANSLTSQKYSYQSFIGGPYAAGAIDTGRDTLLGYATTAINTATTDLLIQATVQWSGASATNVVTRTMYVAEVF